MTLSLLGLLLFITMVFGVGFAVGRWVPSRCRLDLGEVYRLVDSFPEIHSHVDTLMIVRKIVTFIEEGYTYNEPTP